ncbi:MAG: hypothetical protein EP329_06280 [Deltaproteobacteria bacterium]|nr:MAG: hypothetical protein EP329_06280 [Deltaproteobacteria bacterium]
MKRYENGTEAPYGLYLSASPIDVRFVGAEGEALDGREGARYLHLPAWMVVALGPALGGAFVMAFPLLVIAAVLGLALTLTFKGLGTKHSYVARANWQPAAAYFDQGATGDDVDPLWDAEMAALEREVMARAEIEKRQG